MNYAAGRKKTLENTLQQCIQCLSQTEWIEQCNYAYFVYANREYGTPSFYDKVNEPASNPNDREKIYINAQLDAVNSKLNITLRSAHATQFQYYFYGNLPLFTFELVSSKQKPFHLHLETRNRHIGWMKRKTTTTQCFDIWQTNSETRAIGLKESFWCLILSVYKESYC